MMAPIRLLALVPLGLLAACDNPAPVPVETGGERAAAADRIEAAVARMLPDVTLTQYARHYAEVEDGRVVGVYLRRCGSGFASCKEAQRQWVARNQLPVVVDGGCGVINVEYDLVDDALVTAACNGEA